MAAPAAGEANGAEDLTEKVATMQAEVNESFFLERVFWWGSVREKESPFFIILTFVEDKSFHPL